METAELKKILEAALLAAEEPLSLNHMEALFSEDAQPGHKRLKEALGQLAEDCEDRGIELKEVASGFRLQVRETYQPWVSRLWEHKPPRYSRALLETLSLIAYRQPVTRSEIEEVRGVSVSSNIIRTLQEREWIRVVGHRDVPGRPALLGTTHKFLDYFNLKSLDELPTLAEIKDIEDLEPELELADDFGPPADAAPPDANEFPDDEFPDDESPNGESPEDEPVTADEPTDSLPESDEPARD